MEDVLEVYSRPYTPRRPVVCFDEKSKELHDHVLAPLPVEPGHSYRQDSHYKRNGTLNLFLQVEPLAGKRKVRVTERRTALDCAESLRQLVEEDYPDAEVIVLVTDNLNTHSPACLYEAFPPAQARYLASKIEWHYTPEHGSWLNIAECELSVLSRQCLNRRLGNEETLVAQVAAWEAARNGASVRIDWQFTTADARIKLKRLYPVIKETK